MYLLGMYVEPEGLPHPSGSMYELLQTYLGPLEVRRPYGGIASPAAKDIFWAIPRAAELSSPKP